MSRARPALLFAPLLLAAALRPAAAADPPPEPRLTVESERWLTLGPLPVELSSDEIRPHLTSGLTTTMAIRVAGVRGRSGKALGGARVGIRYELWDEIFLLEVLAADGRPRHETVASEEKLFAWWSALELPVLDLAADPPYTAEKVKVTLDIVPFSRSEQDDTQRWYSESVHRAGRAASETAATSDSLESLFSILISTSIQRRPLTSFVWSLELPAGTRPP